jgi:hypothetical protein
MIIKELDQRSWGLILQVVELRWCITLYYIIAEIILILLT